MLPVIVLDVLAEAWYYVRLGLTAKRYYDQGEATVEAVESIVNRKITEVTASAEETAFLYILGREVASVLYPDEGHRIDGPIFNAIHNYLETRTSEDIHFVMSNFMVELGFHLNEEFGDVTDRITAIENQPADEFALSDPLLAFFSGTSAFDKPDDDILLALGMYPAEWETIYQIYKSGPIGAAWQDSFTSRETGYSVSIMSTALGFLVAGASQGASHALGSVTIVGGPDTLALATPGIITGRSLIRPKAQLPDDRSITNQMIQMMSERTMAQKGFIYLPMEKAWAYPYEVDIAKDDKTGKPYLTRRANSRIIAGTVININEADRFSAIVDGAKVLASHGIDALKASPSFVAMKSKLPAYTPKTTLK